MKGERQARVPRIKIPRRTRCLPRRQIKAVTWRRANRIGKRKRRPFKVPRQSSLLERSAYYPGESHVGNTLSDNRGYGWIDGNLCYPQPVHPDRSRSQTEVPLAAQPDRISK